MSQRRKRNLSEKALAAQKQMEAAVTQAAAPKRKVGRPRKGSTSAAPPPPFFCNEEVRHFPVSHHVRRLSAISVGSRPWKRRNHPTKAKAGKIFVPLSFHSY